MNLYEYRIEYYDELDKCNKIDYGYTIAENYRAAMDNLTDWYGEDETTSIKLNYINDKNTILIFSTSTGNTERPAMMDLINKKNACV